MNKTIILIFNSKNGCYEIFKNKEIIYVTYTPIFNNISDTFEFNSEFFWSFIEDELEPEKEKLALDFINTYNIKKRIDEKVLNRYNEISNVYNIIKKIYDKIIKK